jgi:hypothetical protein
LSGVEAPDDAEGRHMHARVRGIAAVTLEQPQFGGCAHELRGRPGLRTGIIIRSFWCVHLVDLCPRMHGSL